ncbi:restriction endonuclease subunit S [Methanococcoides alaskense]|uniref:Type I restriction enzyme S subunit n=1 Tax=Methanococcoides alaskense TaxID=325778 RepID=A0AA90TZX6_9EURY|nr:restriction endonuclease subunit S [Methanococcoides alaskense]MDA0525729.1 restriction endonuclease subunit S [Methanococcoides alaskense]MDR6222955.1 type I restriction enzyme S subunit [Methanococcoides alaskense]
MDEKVGWIETELSQMAEIIMGQSPPSSTYNKNGIGLPFFQGKAEFTELHPVVSKWCSKPKKLAETNDILISVRAPVGTTNIANQNCCIGRGLAAIRYSYCNKYLFYFLRLIEKELDKKGTGTTFKAISGAVLKSEIIPLSPLPEQRAIVSKIEQLFSELDNGIANLKLTQQQLKVYRQAVLKKAFEGELTNEWRKQQTELPYAKDLLEQIRVEREESYSKKSDEWKRAVKEWEDVGKKGKKPTKPKKSKETKPITEVELPDLPKGWGWIRVGNLVEEPKYGTSKKCDYNLNGSGVLRIPNIADGFINDSDLKYAQFDSNEIESYRLKYGDILIIRSNGSIDLVGKCALVSVKDEDYLYAGYLIRLRTIGSLINSKYLLNCLSSIDLRHQIESKAKSTSGVNNINSGELQSLIVSICSLSEQQAIIQEIETRLSVCDKVEQDIEANLKIAEALRQSILKKAFEGKLLNERELEEVRNAPDWEPAEALLEKIRVEKVSSSKKGKA